MLIFIFYFTHFSFDCAYFSQKSDCSEETLITKPLYNCTVTWQRVLNTPLRKIPAENWKHCSEVRTLFPPLPKTAELEPLGLNLWLSHFCHTHTASQCDGVMHMGVNFPESLAYLSSIILKAYILFSKLYASIICQGLLVICYQVAESQ